MSSNAVEKPDTDPSPTDPRRYIVVARRYRPQTFVELIGQEHVAQALSNAISTHRVGHAYLFTGARGVGKTSAARIFAKALNCETGPTPVPCNRCDICRSIGTGEDMDVLEIDGASNRGIEEIRQLRQNAGVRPSRAHYKIYIIDEVHMLTREAFNALLKTLEEPPEHVKFIFCTTEPTKIPITILSRCQRFDFAGILTRSIRQRLEQIVAAEGVEADSDALEILARRAAGSMRDSQSLLEQLLAFSPGKITVADVHGMLGTAGEERLASLLTHLIERDSAGALADLDAAMSGGVDPGQLIEQLFGSLRDCMVAAVGCPAEAFLYTSPSGADRVAEAGKRLGLNTLLAIMQILDQTLARMRYSTQGRILAELALVRISQLEDLDELADLIGELQSGQPAPGAAGGSSSATGGSSAATGGSPARDRIARADKLPVPPPPTAKKKYEDNVAGTGHHACMVGVPSLVPSAEAASTASATPATSHGTRSVPATDDASVPFPLSPANAAEIWNQAISRISGMVADHARQFASITIAAPSRLVVHFRPAYAVSKSACERPEQVVRFEQALAEVSGQPIRVEFALAGDDSTPAPAAAKAVPAHQRLLDAARHPLVQRAAELFGAQPVRVDDLQENPLRK